MKKFLSTILAVVMVLSSMAMVVSAEDSNIPTSNGIWANGNPYSSIDAAAAALSTTGGTIYVHGVVEVGSRQTIAYDGITLEGVTDDAALVASDNFVNASTTNRKAVLTVTATGTTNIKNISVDGSAYGEDLELDWSISGDNDDSEFNVVRLNAGTVILENVDITGSIRTLLSIGTSNSAANVTATNLNLTGYTKKVSNSFAFPDLSGVNGSFEMVSGNADCWVATENACTMKFPSEGTYAFTYLTQTVWVSPRHLVNTYNDSETSTLDLSGYKSILTGSANKAIAESMVRYVKTNEATMSDVKAGFITMIDDLLARKNLFGGSLLNSNEQSIVNNYKNILNGTVE